MSRASDPSPPSPLLLAGGAWARHRAVDGTGKVLFTAPDGRFLLVPADELDALRRGAADAANATRRRLESLGFLHAPTDAQAAHDAADGGAERRVLDVDGEGARAPMTEAEALAALDRVFESPAASLALVVRCADLGASGAVVGALVARARRRSVELGRPLWMLVRTHAREVAAPVLDALLDARAYLALAFDGAREVHDANRGVTGAPPHDVAVAALRAVHARYAARGIDAPAAYVTAVVTVTRATVDGGADALVAALLDAGVVFAELQRAARATPEELACSPAEFARFHTEACRRIVELNEAGTLLVEKRLALALEALVAAPSLRGAAPGGAERERAHGCRACAYDPYCGAGLVRRYTLDDEPVARSYGTDWCATSLGGFDAIFRALASPEGAKLRRVFARWMRARDRVAAADL